MASEDSEWVVESIAGFLSSPTWSLPVTDFIEQKCSVFDAEEENKLSYTEIHQQYKELVENVLESYLEEVGITEEQFLDACTSPLAQSDALQTIFQPVLAAEDFEVFKSLMVQRNIELQLQALRMIQERNGMLPECLTGGADMVTELEQQEMRILKEVLRKSKEEYELDLARKRSSESEIASTSDRTDHNTEEVILENAKQAETQLKQEHQTKTEHLQKACDGLNKTSETTTKGKSLNSDETKKKKDPSKNSSDQKEKLLPGTNSKSSTKILGPLRAVVKRTEIPQEPSSSEVKEPSSSEAAEVWLERARKEAGISGSMTELTEAEKEQLRKRAEYLNKQRDKLIHMKKEQRNKQLAQIPEKPIPKTEPETKQEMTEAERKTMEKRKQLAEKLKEEVIKK